MKTKTKGPGKRELNAKLKVIDAKLDKIWKEEEKLNKQKREIRSQLFKIETGYAYGDFFTFKGKEYEILNSSHVFKVGGTNNRYAWNLREFLKGEKDSPFNS